MDNIVFIIQFLNSDDEIFHQMEMTHGLDFGAATFLLMNLRDMTVNHGSVRVTQDDNMVLKIAPFKKETMDG